MGLGQKIQEIVGCDVEIASENGFFLVFVKDGLLVIQLLVIGKEKTFRVEGVLGFTPLL
jgi:hypothetical protein